MIIKSIYTKAKLEMCSDRQKYTYYEWGVIRHPWKVSVLGKHASPNQLKLKKKKKKKKKKMKKLFIMRADDMIGPSAWTEI